MEIIAYILLTVAMVMITTICIYAKCLAKHDCSPERCKICGASGKLYQRRCPDCWMSIAQSLAICDDCGRLWEAGHDANCITCPRCRPIKLVPKGIIPPADLTHSEKLHLQQARAIPVRLNQTLAPITDTPTTCSHNLEAKYKPLKRN